MRISLFPLKIKGETRVAFQLLKELQESAITPIRDDLIRNMKLKKMRASVCVMVLRVLAFVLAGPVASAATNSLVFKAQPVNTVVGAAISNVVVQVVDSKGSNVLQGGVAITLVLNKTGLAGTANISTTTNGTATFTNLTVTPVSSGDTLTASATGFKSAVSSSFSITQGKTSVALTATANPVSYGQPAMFSATVSVVAPASGTLSGIVTFKDGSTTLGTGTLNATNQATFTTTNRLLAGTHSITAVFGGNTNFSTGTSGAFSLTVGKLALTVSGITASNKVYDTKTTATINVSNAVLSAVLSGDNVILGSSAAKGAFADKNVGMAKIVNISGLTIAGTNAGNYSLTQPTTTANITAGNLTVTAKGVNKIYDGTTNATVTLADNHLAGDVVADSYAFAAFTNKNIGTAKAVTVFGLTIAGTDSGNYVLTNSTAVTTANITPAPLTVSGITASNKVYDAKTAAALNFGGATLLGVVGGDTITLNTTNAKGLFANKNIGTAKTVTVSGLTVVGTGSTNYSLAQPATTASISVASLTVTAKGVNKVYDGTTNAAVTLADNRVAGDVLTDADTAAFFASTGVATNKPISVVGISITGTDSTNYTLLNSNAVTVANITAAKLTMTADSLSRPYGTTNPPLTFFYSGFVNGETNTTGGVTGTPVLATTAKTNSTVGSYPITIAKGTLASVNYAFTLVNGVLTVTKMSTAALLTSGLNPALTNQNITFAAKVSPMVASVAPLTGQVQFKSNGTNILGTPVTLTNGTINLTVVATALASSTNGSVLVTAEYSDPAGNFSSSTNSVNQSIVVVTPPPAIGKMTLAPILANGTVQATLLGTPGQTFVLQVSSDMVHWTSVSTNVADATGAVSIIESNAMQFPSRFYRGMMP